MFIKLNRRGFTLVEIMIVVAIIGLLAAIAIPNLLRARMNSNEGAVKLDLKTFSSANESYRAAQNPPVYSPSVALLVAPAAGPGYIDASWNTANAAPGKHGYLMAYGVADPTFGMMATHIANAALTDYCTDQTGIVYYGGAGPATGCTGTPLGG